ncbi:MAG: hypothetical protein ACXWIN_01000 [Burkholderiaceae bacterium]
MRLEIPTRSIQIFSAASFLSSKILAAIIFLLMLLLLPMRSNAHSLSVNECKEGSDFIRNAAVARDNGAAEMSFIDRISDDIEVIRAFPPQLRWFVQDDDDAKLLLSAAVNVFHHPKSAHTHQVEFFNDCIANAKATASTRKIGM